MSSTRKAEPGTHLRQERYASDPAFNEQLKASAVARKCSIMPDPSHRELCLFLQYASMQPGGLSAMAADFLKRYADRIGSPTMRKHSGLKTFDAAIVRAVREELGSLSFLLKGEADRVDPFGHETFAAENLSSLDYYAGVVESVEEVRARHVREAESFPESYPATAFIDYCMEQAESGLEDWLTAFCLDPYTTLTCPPGWFGELEQSLKDYMADRRADALAGKVVSSIGEQINDALDYAWEEKCLIHINGVARMGKTFQVKQWCKSHPGRVRYVQVPSGNDDISFFRSIARSLGTAAGSAMKTTQIKRQIEDAIQDSGIMLVFDESHYLFPQYKDVRSSPRRVNWVLTEIVNKGIPVAMITTPQFDISQKAIVNGSGWASEQLDGRIAYRLDLPTVLPSEDLIAIARHYLPRASSEVLQLLSAYARRSGKYLAGIEAGSKRSRFLARKEGRDVPNGADLEAALTQVDPAIKELFNPKQEPQDVCKPPATAKKRACRPVAQTVHPPGKKILVTA
ncbi:MAG: TniB family NTP-binding protein [Kiritimatiellales bacterium]|nr:TniB family NTP-binding protein [Kiritimatiellales bacterium]